MKSEEQIAKEFVLWGRVPEGYGETSTTEDGIRYAILYHRDRPGKIIARRED